ncbi:MAG: hypothetical protein VCF24_14485, partial [Candidatus Latescibacterota bacterium]
LLQADPELISARGFQDPSYPYTRLQNATLLHLTTGVPQRVRLPDNFVELAQQVLQAGANPDALTADSTTVMEMVFESSQIDWSERRSAYLDTLLDAGAGNGRALWNALMHRELEIAQRLVDRGAPLNLRFAAALNLVDVVDSFFVADDQLSDDAGALFRPDANARPTDKQLIDEALHFAAFTAAAKRSPTSLSAAPTSMPSSSASGSGIAKARHCTRPFPKIRLT